MSAAATGATRPLPVFDIGDVTEYEWTVEGVSDLLQFTKSVESPVFIVPGLDGSSSSWCLSIEKGSSENTLGFFLKNKNAASLPEAHVMMTLSYKRLNGTFQSTSLSRTFESNGDPTWGKKNFVRLDECASKDQAITVKARVQMMCRRDPNDDVAHAAHSSTRLPSLASVLWHRRDEDGDIVIAAQGTNIRVHRWVLEERSSVFRAMFKAGMQESATKTINEQSTRPDILLAVLEFMYLGELKEEIIRSSARDIFQAADLYDLLPLKALCVTEMLQFTNPAEVVHVLQLGILHGSSKLKNASYAYIARHLELLSQYPEAFATVMASEPGAVREILRLGVDPVAFASMVGTLLASYQPAAVAHGGGSEDGAQGNN